MPLPEALTHKYGPLPGYAWLGLAGAGTFLYLRHRNAAAPPSTAPANDQATVDGYPGSSGGGGDGSGGSNGYDYAGVPLAGSDLLGTNSAAQLTATRTGNRLARKDLELERKRLKEERRQTRILRRTAKHTRDNGRKHGKAKPPDAHHRKNGQPPVRHPAPARRHPTPIRAKPSPVRSGGGTGDPRHHRPI